MERTFKNKRPEESVATANNKNSFSKCNEYFAALAR
jgi:hypothetical protein